MALAHRAAHISSRTHLGGTNFMTWREWASLALRCSISRGDQGRRRTAAAAPRGRRRPGQAALPSNNRRGRRRRWSEGRGGPSDVGEILCRDAGDVLPAGRWARRFIAGGVPARPGCAEPPVDQEPSKAPPTQKGRSARTVGINPSTYRCRGPTWAWNRFIPRETTWKSGDEAGGGLPRSVRYRPICRRRVSGWPGRGSTRAS